MIFKNIEISDEDKRRICSNDRVLIAFTRILIELRDPKFYPKNTIRVFYENFGTPEEELNIMPMFESTDENWAIDDAFFYHFCESEELHDIAYSIGAEISPYLI